MKILKQLLFIALISGGSLIASLSDKDKHDLINSSGLPTTSIDQIQRNLSRLKKHGHLSAANKVQTILDTRRGAQSADTQSDQQIAAALAEIKQQLELDKKIDQLALQLQQSKQQKPQAPSATTQKPYAARDEIKTIHAEAIVDMSDDQLYELFDLNPNATGQELAQKSSAIIEKWNQLSSQYGTLSSQGSRRGFKGQAAVYQAEVDENRSENRAALERLEEFLTDVERKMIWQNPLLTPSEIMNLSDAEMYKLFNLNPERVETSGLRYINQHRNQIKAAYEALKLKYHKDAAMQKIDTFYKENIKGYILENIIGKS